MKGSRTGRDLVIAVLIALGVAAALFMDSRIEGRAYEPYPVVQWAGAAAGISAVALNPAPSGPARKR